MRLLALGLLAVSLLAACGGGSDNSENGGAVDIITVETAPSGSGATLPDWVESRLADAPGEDVALVFSTSDYGLGENRIGFLVVARDGGLVQAPTATVLYAREGDNAPVTTTASLEALGPHSHPEGAEAHDHLDATDIYVTHIETPAAGRYWIAVEPEDESIQGIGVVQVLERSVSPAVGDKAFPSDNPTLADAAAEEITTASPPDTELLRSSIADAIADRTPFVVAFATPKFCQSRTCGPTVEALQEVARDPANAAIRFIHVEIYEDNNPKNGYNRWVKEWKLPTEPWVFVVDRDGVIRARFEGSVSVDELEAAVQRTLFAG